MFSMVYKGQRRKIKIRTPWISTLSHEIHTEMKKLVFPAIKIDSLNLSHSLVIPHPSISLDSFSHTLLFIISFPSTYFSWFTLGFWNHLHVLLLNPLRFPPSFTFTDTHFFPLSLTFTDTPPLLGSPITYFCRFPPMGSPITYFYWFPLGLPQGDTWPVRYRECCDSCPASCCRSDRSVVGCRSLIGCHWPRCWVAWRTHVGGRPLRNLSP